MTKKCAPTQHRNSVCESLLPADWTSCTDAVCREIGSGPNVHCLRFLYIVTDLLLHEGFVWITSEVSGKKVSSGVWHCQWTGVPSPN